MAFIFTISLLLACVRTQSGFPKMIGGMTGDTELSLLAFSETSELIFVGGTSQDTGIFDLGSDSMQSFIMKLDIDTNVLWSKYVEEFGDRKLTQLAINENSYLVSGFETLKYDYKGSILLHSFSNGKINMRLDYDDLWLSDEVDWIITDSDILVMFGEYRGDKVNQGLILMDLNSPLTYTFRDANTQSVRVLKLLEHNNYLFISGQQTTFNAQGGFVELASFDSASGPFNEIWQMKPQASVERNVYTFGVFFDVSTSALLGMENGDKSVEIDMIYFFRIEMDENYEVVDFLKLEMDRLQARFNFYSLQPVSADVVYHFYFTDYDEGLFFLQKVEYDSSTPKFVSTLYRYNSFNWDVSAMLACVTVSLNNKYFVGYTKEFYPYQDSDYVYYSKYKMGFIETQNLLQQSCNKFKNGYWLSYDVIDPDSTSQLVTNGIFRYEISYEGIFEPSTTPNFSKIILPYAHEYRDYCDQTQPITITQPSLFQDSLSFAELPKNYQVASLEYISDWDIQLLYEPIYSSLENCFIFQDNSLAQNLLYFDISNDCYIDQEFLSSNQLIVTVSVYAYFEDVYINGIFDILELTFSCTDDNIVFATTQENIAYTIGEDELILDIVEFSTILCGISQQWPVKYTFNDISTQQQPGFLFYDKVEEKISIYSIYPSQIGLYTIEIKGYLQEYPQYSDSTQFQIKINENINPSAPKFTSTPKDQTVDAGSILLYDLPDVVEPDGDDWSISLVTQIDYILLDGTTLVITPSEDESGVFTLEIALIDDQFSPKQSTYSIQITINDLDNLKDIQDNQTTNSTNNSVDIIENSTSNSNNETVNSSDNSTTKNESNSSNSTNKSSNSSGGQGYEFYNYTWDYTDQNTDQKSQEQPDFENNNQQERGSSTLAIKTVKISDSGEMLVTFSHNLKIKDNWQNSIYDSISVELQFEEGQYNFTWEVISFKDDSIVIQIEMEDPDALSSQDVKILQIDINLQGVIATFQITNGSYFEAKDNSSLHALDNENDQVEINQIKISSSTPHKSFFSNF